MGCLRWTLPTGPLGLRKTWAELSFLAKKTTPRTAPKNFNSTTNAQIVTASSKFMIMIEPDLGKKQEQMEVGSHQNGIPKHVFLRFFSLPTFAQGFVPCPKVQWVFKYEGDAVGAHGARDPSVSPLSPVPPLPAGSAHGGTFPSNDSVAAEAHATQRKPLSERKQVAMATEEKGCVCRFFLRFRKKNIWIDRFKGRCLCFWALSI